MESILNCDNDNNNEIIKVKFNSYSVGVHTGPKLYNFHFFFFQKLKIRKKSKIFSQTTHE